jgi:hypothetical protein
LVLCLPCLQLRFAHYIHSLSLSPNRRVTPIILKGFARLRLFVNGEVRSSRGPAVTKADTHNRAVWFRLDYNRPIRAIASFSLECLHSDLLSDTTVYSFDSWKAKPNNGVSPGSPEQVWDSKRENQKHREENADHATQSMGKAVPKGCPS